MILKNKTWIFCLIPVFLLLFAGFAGAEKESLLERGQTFEKDYFAAARNIKIEGTAKGDLISVSHTLSNTGVVGGDIISAAANIISSGDVSGNLRCASGNIVMSGGVGKNVNIFAEKADLTNKSVVGGSLTAFCGNMNVAGKVTGDTIIYAENVTLAGEFFGDVQVNAHSNEDEKNGRNLIILPGAVIHGKLTYSGITPAEIQNGASVGNFRWEKTTENVKEAEQKITAGYVIKRLIRTLITAVLYFLIASLFMKAFPPIFTRQERIIRLKTLNVIGLGFLTVISVTASIIITIVLSMLSLFAVLPSIAVFFGSSLIFLYILIYYFSTIPVSLWLGDRILSSDCNIACRFGTGLTVVTLIMFLLETLKELDNIGFIFGFFYFLLSVAIVIVGAGTFLYSLRDVWLAVKITDFED